MKVLIPLSVFISVSPVVSMLKVNEQEFLNGEVCLRIYLPSSLALATKLLNDCYFLRGKFKIELIMKHEDLIFQFCGKLFLAGHEVHSV